MKRSVALVFLILLPLAACGQTNLQTPHSSATPKQAAPQPTRKPLSTVLMNDIDTHHVKMGDLVKVRLYSSLSAPGISSIPPGSLMTGHVIEVSRLGKGSIESRLAVVFDQVQMTGGQTVAIHMGIAGLAAAPPINRLETQMDGAANPGSPFPGARSTGLTVDPSGNRSTANTTGGTGGTRVSRQAIGEKPVDQNGTTNVETTPPAGPLGAVAAVGTTVPGISLRFSPTAQSVLVSTSNNIVLRSGTSLALLPILDPQQ